MVPFVRATTLTFEDLPDAYFYNGGDQNIGDLYAGITFGPDVTGLSVSRFGGYDSSGFPPHSGDVVIWDATDSTITISFANIIDSFGIWYTTFDPLTLEAFDINGNPLDTAIGAPNTDGTTGTTSYLSLADPGIASVALTSTPGFFTLDNMTIEGGNAAPEPSPFNLIIGAAILLAIIQFRSRISSGLHVAALNDRIRSWRVSKRLAAITIVFAVSSIPASAQNLFDQTDDSATSNASWYGDNWYQLGTNFSGALQTLTIKCFTSGGNSPSYGSITLNEFSDSGYSTLTNSYSLSGLTGTQCGPALAYVSFTNLSITLLPSRYYRLDTSDTLQNASVRLLGTTSKGLAMYDNFVYGTGRVESYYSFYPYIIPSAGPPPSNCPPSPPSPTGTAYVPARQLFSSTMAISSLGLWTSPSGGPYCCSQSYVALLSDVQGSPGSTLATSSVVTLSQYDSSSERKYSFSPAFVIPGGTAFWVALNTGPSPTTNGTQIYGSNGIPFLDYQTSCAVRNGGGAINLGPPNTANRNGFTSEPINTATGNYYLSHTDLTVPGKGLTLTFTRNYNSLDSYVGPLGAGWTHSYNIALTVAQSAVTLKDADGHVVGFTPLGGGNYAATSAGVFDVLTQNQNGSFTLTRKNQIKLTFSSGGLLTNIVDRNGNTQTLNYASDNLIAIVDTAGRTFPLTYNTSGQLSSISDPVGRSWQYSYDTNGNLASVRDPLGGVTQYSYDANHRMTSATDARGITFLQNTFDALGRVVTQTNGRGFATTLAYNVPSAGITTITDPLSNATQHVYDGALRLVQVIDANGGIVEYGYDSNNDQTSITNQNGNMTGFSYDGQGNTTGIIDPLGDAQSFTYDAQNDLLTATSPKGALTTFTYDGNGNLLRIKDALNDTTAFMYTQSGQVATRTDPLGNVTVYNYDSAGNLVQATDPLGNATTFTYDGVGRLDSTTDANKHTASISYDALSRITKTTDALHNATQFAYDPIGNLLAVTDANREVTIYAYDATNDLTTVTDALNGVTHYGYDANNNRTSLTNAKANTTTYSYDALNRLAKITDPLTFSTSYGYDAVGNTVSTTDANGSMNQYAYDALNRLIAGNFADGSAVSYTYDSDGNRASMTDWRGTTKYAYDALDRALSITSPGPNIIQYAYDVAGNRTSLGYPDGRTVRYQYDALNRLSGLTDWAGKSTNYSYDAVGNLSGFAYPNGAVSTYSYDAANRLLQIANKSGTQVLLSFTYALDNVGTRMQVTSAAAGVTKYGYDALYRLTSWTVPSGQVTQYNYDAVGNRTSMVSSGGTTVYGYDAADRMLSAGTTSYSYDKNGNQIAKTTGSTTVAYAYDTLNRLTAASGTGINSQYRYDGDGNRVSQTVPTGTYQYFNDTATALPVVLNELGPDGNIDYLYGLSMISETSSAFQYFYQTDGIGSAASLTDATGALKANYAYDPWGKLTTPIDPLGTKNKDKFTGEPLDPGTGFYFLRARYYDPTSGRFLARDPLSGWVANPQSENRYTYVLGNPGRLTDHRGLSAIDSEAVGRPTNSGSTVATAPRQPSQPQAPPPAGTVHSCLVEVQFPQQSSGVLDGIQIYEIVFGIVTGDLIGIVEPYGPLPTGPSGGYLVPAKCAIT